MLPAMSSRVPIIVVLALAAAGCGPVETTNGYQGEMSFSVFATDTATGWTLDLTHDIFWDGESSDAYEVSCTVRDEGAVTESYTLRAVDTTFEQGFDLTIVIYPYEGSGVYELVSGSDPLSFEMALSTLGTLGQNYDLSTRSSGSCTVTLARDDLFGDFSCPALEEYVSYAHKDLPFTVTGSWECAELALED
jgi:hypothetical protein